jgi:hypothetical protein
MPMVVHAAGDHVALQNIQGGEQHGNAVPNVVVVMVPCRRIEDGLRAGIALLTNFGREC